MNPYYHAKSSMRKWGGSIKNYKDVHDFLDHTKAHVPDMRHRALLHNSWGIFIAERMFGDTIEVTGEYTVKQVPTRLIVERHIIEDLGKIPTVQDYLAHMTGAPWMTGKAPRSGNPMTMDDQTLPTWEEMQEKFNVR